MPCILPLAAFSRFPFFFESKRYINIPKHRQGNALDSVLELTTPEGLDRLATMSESSPSPVLPSPSRPSWQLPPSQQSYQPTSDILVPATPPVSDRTRPLAGFLTGSNKPRRVQPHLVSSPTLSSYKALRQPHFLEQLNRRRATLASPMT